MKIHFQSTAGPEDTPVEVTARVERYADAIGAPEEMRHMAPGYEVEVEVTPAIELSRKELARLEDEALSRALAGPDED